MESSEYGLEGRYAGHDPVQLGSAHNSDRALDQHGYDCQKANRQPEKY
ncbi:hypothetical protein ARTHRO9V_90163 [Arthrobacter sp. 9V]|nr:hypothetical protein ARTHRO9V_90163 [Arthrobacter sp. 9V]